jgi:hypothetical protein
MEAAGRRRRCSGELPIFWLLGRGEGSTLAGTGPDYRLDALAALPTHLTTCFTAALRHYTTAASSRQHGRGHAAWVPPCRFSTQHTVLATARTAPTPRPWLRRGSWHQHPTSTTSLLTACHCEPQPADTECHARSPVSDEVCFPPLLPWRSPRSILAKSL